LVVTVLEVQEEEPLPAAPKDIGGAEAREDIDE